MTNQPYATGRELTGNQCIQPPVPHQYGVWLFSTQASSSIFPSLRVSSPHLRLCSVLLWKPRHLLYFKDVFVSLAAYPGDWAPRQGDAVWKLPSASGEGQEPALSVRFLQARSLRGDDSWRNALLIPPNAGHMRAAWVASRQGEKNDVCVRVYGTFITCRRGTCDMQGTCDRYSTMEPRPCAACGLPPRPDETPSNN